MPPRVEFAKTVEGKRKGKRKKVKGRSRRASRMLNGCSLTFPFTFFLLPSLGRRTEEVLRVFYGDSLSAIVGNREDVFVG
jgi:hypothetical protein